MPPEMEKERQIVSLQPDERAEFRGKSCGRCCHRVKLDDFGADHKAECRGGLEPLVRVVDAATVSNRSSGKEECRPEMW